MSLAEVGKYLALKTRRLFKRDHPTAIYYHGDKSQKGYHSQPTDVSFFESVSAIFQFAQLISIFPIRGLHQRTPSALRFRWLSPQICISVIFILFGLAMGGCEYANVAEKKVTPRSLVKVLYYLDNTSSYLFFVLLARKWKPIMCMWREKELVFLKKPYTIKRFKLKHSITVVAFWLIFFTGIGMEHESSKIDENFPLLFLILISDYSGARVLPSAKLLRQNDRRRPL
jgi:Trehalose receptor